MQATHFVDSFRSGLIGWLISTVIWLLAFALISVLAWGWTKGLQEVSTRWGHLALSLALLLVSGFLAFLKAHVILTTTLRNLLR